MTYHPARWRLDAAKRKAAENAAKIAERPYLESTFPTDWRAVARKDARRRFARKKAWGPLYVDAQGRRWRWLEDVDGSGLHVTLENATAATTRNNGYYVDTFDDDWQHGAVLATRDSESPRALFFPAISDPHNAGAFRVLWEPTDDRAAAAHTADSLAESDAERQREYCAAWQAGARWAELGGEVKQARAALLAILQDRKSASGSETLCAVIREKVQSLLDSIRDAREARMSLADGEGEHRDDWSRAFWPGDPELRAAFNEGAGEAVLA